MKSNDEPMTEAMYYVLLALITPNYGYKLISIINELSNDRINMGAGTIYGILTRLLKENLINILSDDGRRKTYELTESGRIILFGEYQRIKTLVNDGKIIEGGIL